MEQAEFRSPLRKLVTFFKASRDNWKEKCQRAKYGGLSVGSRGWALGDTSRLCFLVVS